MATVTLASPQVVRINFTNTPSVTAANTLLTECASEIQGRIARAFEQVQTYRGPLARNSPAYNLRKALSGFDLRRGHRTGAFQRTLYTAILYRVSGSGRTWTIRFSDDPLYNSLSYARYYAKSKAPGGSIVGVRNEWLADCRTRAQALDNSSFVPPAAPEVFPIQELESEGGFLQSVVRFITGGA